MQGLMLRWLLSWSDQTGHGSPELEDVARELTVTRKQVYALVGSGDRPAIKVGCRGQWRVERPRLETRLLRLRVERAATGPSGAGLEPEDQAVRPSREVSTILGFT